MNKPFFLIVHFQGCAKVRLIVGIEIFETIFQKKKQSMTMFYCFAKGNFVGETVTSGNLTKNKQLAKSANYRRLLVETCCKQIIASETPPLIFSIKKVKILIFRYDLINLHYFVFFRSCSYHRL